MSTQTGRHPKRRGVDLESTCHSEVTLVWVWVTGVKDLSIIHITIDSLFFWSHVFLLIDHLIHISFLDATLVTCRSLPPKNIAYEQTETQPL